MEEEEELLLPRSPSRPSVPPAPTQEGNEDKMGHGQERVGRVSPLSILRLFSKKRRGREKEGPFMQKLDNAG